MSTETTLYIIDSLNHYYFSSKEAGSARTLFNSSLFPVPGPAIPIPSPIDTHHGEQGV